jgi:WhiB family redox-sensing transcriptional regulator
VSRGALAAHSTTMDAGNGDWRHSAACLDSDAETFFPIGNTGPAIQQTEEAKAVCHRCEVRETCLEWALTQGEEAGIWGGLSEDERRSLKRRTDRNRQAAARGHQVATSTATPKTPPPARVLVSATFTKAAVSAMRDGGLSWLQISRQLGARPSTIRAVHAGERAQVGRSIEDAARAYAVARRLVGTR